MDLPENRHHGRTFADEHFKLKFDKPGRLAMANRGKDCNHSQFFITCAEATHCNDSCVVFGEVVWVGVRF